METILRVGDRRRFACWWFAFLALEIANWDRAGLRALLLAVFGAGAVGLLGTSRRSLAAASGPPMSRLGMLAALAVAHLTWFAVRWIDPHPHFVDIGLTTISAARAIVEGRDPYTSPIDPQGVAALKAFAGYKYAPMMAITYLPLCKMFGERGLLITNLLTDFGMALMINHLAARLKGPAAGLAATVFYLSLPMVPAQLYQAGVTDFVPVLALLIGVNYSEGSPLLSGFFMGLSISAKPFPGLIGAAYGLGRTGGVRYVAGCFLGLIPLTPFLIHSTWPLIENTLLFNVARAPDSTAWMRGEPAYIVACFRLGALALLISLAVFGWFHDLSVSSRCRITTAAIIISILVGNAAHTNYMLWWTPLFCLIM